MCAPPIVTRATLQAAFASRAVGTNALPDVFWDFLCWTDCFSGCVKAGGSVRACSGACALACGYNPGSGTILA